jgi:hypothetical protein
MFFHECSRLPLRCSNKNFSCIYFCGLFFNSWYLHHSARNGRIDRQTDRQTIGWEGFESCQSLTKALCQYLMYLANRQHNKWFSILSKQYKFLSFSIVCISLHVSALESHHQVIMFTKAYTYCIAMLPNTAILVCTYNYLYLHLK